MTCPHCGNDDESLITLTAFVMKGGQRIQTLKDIYTDPTIEQVGPSVYNCDVCSKEFTDGPSRYSKEAGGGK